MEQGVWELQNVFVIMIQSSLYGSSENICQAPKSQWTQENYLLLSKAAHSVVDWLVNIQKKKIHNALESPPHIYIRPGKEKNQFWKFWCKLHPIQSTLGYLLHVDKLLF